MVGLNGKEVMLVGFDIHMFVKSICDKFIDGSPDMTEDEKKAFRLGINNVLGILDQTLNEWINDGSEGFHNIAVNVPGLNLMTEYTTIREIIKDMEKAKKRRN